MIIRILYGKRNITWLYEFLISLDSLAKMLVARLDNGVIRNDVTKHVISSLKNLFTFHFF